MGIREVTYYEAWCDHSGGEHHIEGGDFSGWSTRNGAEVEVASADGVELPDGRVYCADHIPDDVCPDGARTDRWEHAWTAAGDCEFCPASTV